MGEKTKRLARQVNMDLAQYRAAAAVCVHNASDKRSFNRALTDLIKCGNELDSSAEKLAAAVLSG